MMSEIRSCESNALTALSKTDNLQTKYENLDEFYIKKEAFDLLNQKIIDLQNEMQNVRRSPEYDSEDESQRNESIDDISGEVLDDNEADAADTKSRASLQNLRSNPALLPGQDTNDAKSLMSGGKGGKTTTAANKSPKYSYIQQQSGIETPVTKPIMEVVTTLKDEMGGTTQIKGVSIAAEDEIKSIRKTDRGFDGKSQRSFAGRSMRSRKFGVQQNALLDSLQDRTTAIEQRIEQLSSQTDEMQLENGQGWSLLVQNLPQIEKILNMHRVEGGFVGNKIFNQNPLGQASKAFRELQDEAEEANRRMLSLQEDIELDKEETAKQIDCLSKAVKQLQDHKLRKDELDDKRIRAHIGKALDKVGKDIDQRIQEVVGHVKNLEEPIHAKFIDMSKEAEGLSRQNLRFVALYRECLLELQNEIKEKKQVLDTTQLAFLTADPGLVQQKIAAQASTYHKQKKLIHGIPNQTETGQIWSRYTSEVAQLKVDDLQSRIKQAERDMDNTQIAIKTSIMSPKAINIGDCFYPKTSRHSQQKYNSMGRFNGQAGNPDLDLQVTINENDTGMLFERTDLTAGGTRRRRQVSTSYGNRRRNKPFSNQQQNVVGSLSFGINSNSKLEVASGKTLFMSGPTTSDDGDQCNMSSTLNLHKNEEGPQHTKPIVGQNKLLASHKSVLKGNVAKFIKDHNLGVRHFQNRQMAGGGDMGSNVTTTAVDDPTNLGSDNASWTNSRTGGITLRGAANTTRRSAVGHPKSQTLTLSFKKSLDPPTKRQ